MSDTPYIAKTYDAVAAQLALAIEANTLLTKKIEAQEIELGKLRAAAKKAGR